MKRALCEIEESKGGKKKKFNIPDLILTVFLHIDCEEGIDKVYDVQLGKP